MNYFAFYNQKTQLKNLSFQRFTNSFVAWYPYTNRHHVSGYDFVSKDQLVPKSHPPRKSNIQVIVPPVRSPVSSSGSTQVSWPSSSVNSPLRDAEVRSNNGSFNQPSQISVQGVEEEHVIPCTQQSEETYERYEFKAKRVTRAANGISKKTPVDPNNVEPSRMAKASKKQKLAAVRKQRPRREYRSEDDENYPSSEDENINELINHPNLPVGVVDPNGRTRLEVFGGILKAQQVNLWEQNGKQPQKRQDEDENEDAQSDTDYDGDGGFDDEAWDKQLASEDERNKVTEAPTKEVVGAIVSKLPSPSPGAKQTEIQQHNEHIVPAENATPHSIVVDHPILSQHPITDEPLPSSQLSGMLLSDGENDKIPESLPGSSIELPMAEHLGDNTDENEEEDEIPQAPLMPLNSALHCTAKALDNSDLQYPCSGILHTYTGPAETPKRNDASQVGDGAGIMMEPKGNKSDSLSTVLDSVAPEAVNVSKSQKYGGGVAPALPSSSINSTASPSIQVEETPYKKGVGVLGKDLSPTIAKSKSRIHSVCADEGLDLTLIPGTNMEEPHISQELRSPVLQGSPTSRPVTIPERQMSSQDLPWLSVEPKDPQKGLPDDFARSQEQLMREAQERQKIEVPATSEGNKTRVENDILSHSAAARQVSRSGPRKARKVLKVVDFGTQEIRAAANTRSVTDMLEKQKKEFMDYKESPDITGMTERENSSMHERPAVKPGVEAPEKNNLLNPDDQSPETPNNSSRPNDEEMASGIDQLNIRKRTQSSPSKKVIAAKKPRIDASPYKDTSATTLPSSKKQRNFKAPASSQTESSSKSRMEAPGMGDLGDERGEIGDSEEDDFTMEDCMREDSVKKDFEEKDLEESFELTNDDPMAGFPDIILSDDDDEPMPMVPEIIDLVSDNEESESPEPSQPKSKPELYAGLRMRDIYVPGYEKLTADQKDDLDRRRKEYFGVKTSSERLFSAETQRAMTKTNLEERERESERKSEKEKKASGSKNQGDFEWYHDKDTPMKKLFRHFQELEKSKMKKAELNKPDEE
ncbi:hypothetical protein P167DRAFT_220919 [Morchella conica CCBAS932]|uniref:Uncharacterized protein n=1 Tax=Morchella conica CCBAS932 TaxID=1392247 RepID=A0A3N4KLA0_9PEZI|nr:hypothetical protein P167DRAFT_220919 [Morchella conica CCBAS932]